MAVAKLTVAQKKEIAQKYETDQGNIRQLAREYDVSTALVSRIIKASRNGLRIRGSDSRAGAARAHVLYPRLEEWRQEQGLTQKEMAERAGMPVRTLRDAMYEDIYKAGRKAEFGPCKKTIDGLLKLTCLTYEEAFKRADGMDGN